MRISDWSSDVCSSDLLDILDHAELREDPRFLSNDQRMANRAALEAELNRIFETKTTAAWLAILEQGGFPAGPVLSVAEVHADPQALARSEEHTSGLQSLMRTSYAVFCLKKKK